MRYLCQDESVKNLWAMALDGCDVSQSHSIKSVWSPAGQVVGHPGDDLDDVSAGDGDVGVDDDMVMMTLTMVMMEVRVSTWHLELVSSGTCH